VQPSKILLCHIVAGGPDKTGAATAGVATSAGIEPLARSIANGTTAISDDPAGQTSVQLYTERHISDAAPLLSPEETTRANRFHHSVDRQRYILAHATLRLVLAQQLESDGLGTNELGTNKLGTNEPGPNKPGTNELGPNKPGTNDLAAGATRLVIEQGVRGKPRLAIPPAGIEFNLSYGRKLFAIATAERPVGIDVEFMRETVAFEELGKRFFTPMEAEFVLQGGAPGLCRTFYRIWPRNDAVLKAVGVGLARISEIDVLQDRILVPDVEGDDATYEVRSLEPPPGHAMAIALRLDA
jgi:phosphopantetheinyl transferase